MKRPQVEPRTELRLRRIAQAQYLEVADHVGRCLPRPRDVAVNFAPHLRGGECRLFREQLDRLVVTHPASVDA